LAQPPSWRLQGEAALLQVADFQTIPSKTKQKSLDFLGFIRPNRGFSMGYSDSK
jgi:hypothetical protein